MYNILLEPIKILPGWFRDADCFKNCSKMACFSTDHLAIWVQRSLVEWPIKGPLCHFICLSLPSTQDHNKKLNSSKEDKVVKVKWRTMQCSGDKEVIPTVYKKLTALSPLDISIALSYYDSNTLYSSLQQIF